MQCEGLGLRHGSSTPTMRCFGITKEKKIFLNHALENMRELLFVLTCVVHSVAIIEETVSSFSVLCCFGEAGRHGERERVRKREPLQRESSFIIPLPTWPGRARLKAGPGHSLPGSHMAGRDPTTGAITMASQGAPK